MKKFLASPAFLLAVLALRAEEHTAPEGPIQLENVTVVGAPTPAVDASLPPTRALRIQPTRPLTFPAALGGTGIREGWVRVVVSVDAGGQLLDAMPESYTHEIFAREALRALREWNFLPAAQDGRLVPTRMSFRMDFSDHGASPAQVLSIQTMANQVLGGVTRDHPIIAIVEPPELDQAITAVKAIKPANPANAIEGAAAKNQVRLDFYIDETGQPRMPVVESSPHDAFSHAAVEALLQWRFNPPLRHGQPVSVHVKQDFFFEKGQKKKG